MTARTIQPAATAVSTLAESWATAAHLTALPIVALPTLVALLTTVGTRGGTILQGTILLTLPIPLPLPLPEIWTLVRSLSLSLLLLPA